MLSDALVTDVIAHAMRGGATFAEVYVERWRRRALRVLDGDVKEATSGLEFGAGIRLFFGADVAYAYTNDLSPRSVLDVTGTLLRARGGAGRVDDRGQGGLDFRRRAAAGLHAPAIPFEAHPKRYRLERLREADAGARVAPEIVQVESLLLEWEQDVLVANSDAAWTEDRRVRTRLAVNAIAQEGGQVQTGVAWQGLSGGLEMLERFPPREMGERAATQALTNLRARPAPAGTMPVVIGNAFGGVIFHEAVGHLLETTSVAKKASVLSDKIGEQIASAGVTYIDDGTTPGGWEDASEGPLIGRGLYSASGGGRHPSRDARPRRRRRSPRARAVLRQAPR